MKTPEEARTVLKAKFQRWRAQLLLDALPGAEPVVKFPIAIDLDPPTGPKIMSRLGEVEAWLAAWRAFPGTLSVAWEDRRLQGLGIQSLPVSAAAESAERLADFAGEGEGFRLALGRFLELSARWPEMSAPLSRRYVDLASMAEGDFRRIALVIAFLAENPASGLYPRQLPIAGVHTKWLEAHEGLISALALPVLGLQKGGQDFHALFGLKSPPKNFVNLRILDPALRRKAGGLDSLRVPAGEAARLPLSPSAVMIVENTQTGLAFGDLPGTVLFHGHGRNLPFLGDLPWIKGARAFYWGDIDTHGLAILGQARGMLPGLRSFLMDRATLLSHQEFWSFEKEQYAKQPANLDPDEMALFGELRAGVHGSGVRLEQEPISWALAWPLIQELVGGE